MSPTFTYKKPKFLVLNRKLGGRTLNSVPQFSVQSQDNHFFPEMWGIQKQKILNYKHLLVIKDLCLSLRIFACRVIEVILRKRIVACT